MPDPPGKVKAMRAGRQKTGDKTDRLVKDVFREGLSDIRGTGAEMTVPNAARIGRTALSQTGVTPSEGGNQCTNR